MEPGLSRLGWGEFFDEQWQAWGTPELIPGRIAAEHRGAYEVWSASASGGAHLSGRLRHQLGERELPGVGDWVALDASPHPDRTALIRRVFERRTVFTRGAAGREARAQVIAANVDLVLVVCGLDEDFNLRRIERYVARVFASGAAPLVVLSKADLADDLQVRLAEVREHTPGVEVLALSARQGTGLDALEVRLAASAGSSYPGAAPRCARIASAEPRLWNAVILPQRHPG